MSIEEVSAEQLAELYHHYHHALAADFGCRKPPMSESWDQLSTEEKRCAIAAARLALMELVSVGQEQHNPKRYFAKPGNAEWGC